MFPTSLHALIMEFHDEFNLIEKKQKLHFVITTSYRRWLTDAGGYMNFFGIDEYTAKSEIFSHMGPRLFVTNLSCWHYFMSYFKFEDSLFKEAACLPSVYCQI